MLGYRGEKLRVIGVRTCVRRQPLARWFLWLEKKKKGSITVAYPYPDLSLPWWRTPRPIPPFTLGESSKDHGKFHFSLINGQKKYIANCVFFFSLAVTGIRVIFSAFESRFFCRFLKSIGYPIDERASMKIRKTYRFHRFQRLLFCLFFFYDRTLVGNFYRILLYQESPVSNLFRTECIQLVKTDFYEYFVQIRISKVLKEDVSIVSFHRFDIFEFSTWSSTLLLQF